MEKDATPLLKKEYVPAEELSQTLREKKDIQEWLNKKHEQYMKKQST